MLVLVLALENSLMWLRFCGQLSALCPAGTIGLSLEFQPQVSIRIRSRPEGAVESVPQIVKTLTKQAAGPNYLPLLQGGSVLKRIPGVKTPG